MTAIEWIGKSGKEKIAAGASELIQLAGIQ